MGNNIDLSAGIVDDQPTAKPVDLSAGMSDAQPAPAPQQQTQQQEQPEQQGMLGKAWDWFNKGLISKDTFVRAMTGMTSDQLNQALSRPPAQRGTDKNGRPIYEPETPAHAALRELVRGTVQDTADTASGFTSPMAVSTLSAGELGEAPGALGKVARGVSTAAAGLFGAQGAQQAYQGAKDIHEHGLNPDNARRVIGGTGQAILGGVAAKRGLTDIANRHVDEFAKKVTNTGDERLQELHDYPEKVKAIHQKVVDAEDAAHKAASAAFPDIQGDIELKPATPPRYRGDQMIDPGSPAQTTTFKALQEQRSKLLSDIASESRLVKAAKVPRFDLEKMVDNLHDLDATMDKAALDHGGPEAVDQLHAARDQFSEYMNDFHNSQSPLRKVLSMHPNDTKAIVNHFRPGDVGNRALDTLEKNGVDTNDIRALYGEGNLPNTVTANEAAKLKAAGSDKNYQIMRIKEGIRQTQKSNLQSSANETLPTKNIKSSAPGIVDSVPLVNKLTPRVLTRWELKRALNNLGEPDTISPAPADASPEAAPAADEGAPGAAAIKNGKLAGKYMKGQTNNLHAHARSASPQHPTSPAQAQSDQKVKEIPNGVPSTNYDFEVNNKMEALGGGGEHGGGRARGPKESTQHVVLHTSAIQQDALNEKGGETKSPGVSRVHRAASIAGYNALGKMADKYMKGQSQNEKDDQEQ